MMANHRSGLRALFVSLALIFFVSATSAVQAQVPTPEEHIGFEPGEDYRLIDTDQLYDYYYDVAEASDRVDIRTIGESHRGRELLLMEISSPENLANRDHYRDISKRLANAEGLDDAEARELAEEGKAVIWIDNGLHSTELAHSQHGPELVYHLATDNSDETLRILDDVILLNMPLMNPDGHDVVVDWYRSHRDTPFEETTSPWLYHEYIGHDNNRDWYMLLQNESQAVAEVLYHEWRPQIVVNHHQMGEMPARMFIPPYEDPVNPNMPPLAVRGTNMVGEHMANRFAAEGKSGILQRITFNLWWNGGMRTAPMFHNMVGILTESTHRSPVPRYWDEDDIPDNIVRSGREISMKNPSVFYPDPWEGGWSNMRQMVEYHKTASMGVLDIGSKQRSEWLYNIYQMGRDQIDAGNEGDPYAFIVSPDQWDKPETVEMLNVLRRSDIEIQRSTQAFTAGGDEYPAGTYVVHTAQSSRGHVLDMLDIQEYPERRLYPGGPPEPPYDMAGWTLPIQMGVTVDRIEEPFEGSFETIEGMVELEPGQVNGQAGFGYAFSARSNFADRAASRLLQDGHSVSRVSDGFDAGGSSFDAGAYVVEIAGQGAQEEMESLGEELGIDFTGLAEAPGVDRYALNAPRVALYKPWVANIDEGWTRWVFDNYDIPVDTLHNENIQNDDLSVYDIVILPAQSPTSMMRGHSEGSMPEEYVGGLGTEGATALKRYVENGGTLLAWDGATDFVIEQFSLPVRNRVANVSRSNFFIPGSLVGLELENTHPLTYGMREETGAFFVTRRGSQSRSFRILEPASVEDRQAEPPAVEPFAWFAEEDVLRSGWALGEERYLAGHPAAVRAALGEGNIILVGVRPQFRAQPRATFKFIFNSIMASTAEDLPPVQRATPADDE